VAEPHRVTERATLAIVGAGAAGLMAAIWAGRATAGRLGRIIVLDGARRLGAKILVSGGGRCNVTHLHVSAADFAGSTRPAVNKVLRQFDVPQTVAFFRSLGVELKQEATGKLFPITDRAHTVLDALLAGAVRAGAELLYPRRVQGIERTPTGFRLTGEWGDLTADRVVLATGGQSLPKTGSDGHGYLLARGLGHTVTPYLLPGLVPLLLPAGHFLRDLSGLATPATLTVRPTSGPPLASFTGSTLCTHFGLSGPAVLDISRYFLVAQLDDPAAALHANWWPSQTTAELDQALQSLGRTSPATLLRAQLPERLAFALCAAAGLDPTQPGHTLTRDQRRHLAQTVTDLPLPITGHRGYNYAEVTAGGVPLSELRLNTLESRVCPGLYLCGEICDVDGRIGGFNFQWAWASGYVVGRAQRV
jgi:predicted Rossmann fold flavoprotein